MGCGATTSARHVPDLARPGAGSASSSSAPADDVPTPGLSSEPGSTKRKSKKAPNDEASKRSAENGESKSSKKSRVAKDVEGAQKWSKEECEQLSICHLVRWLEALGKDTSPAVSRDKASQRLWKEISNKKPPALQSVTAAEHLSWWPLQEILRWLEYFECDSEVADKPMLIRMLMENGEALPPPSFLGESAEQDYLTQVQQHVGLLKNSAHSLLHELAKEITEVEAQLNEEGKAPDHAWTSTGLVIADFRGKDAQAELSEANDGKEQEHFFLDVKTGERVDLIQRDPTGWTWCIAAKGRGQGYVPSASVIDIAQVLVSHGSEGEENGTLQVTKGEELEVLVRHYSGWTLCRKANGSEGWVPDTCLSENPRCQATKQHRLILNGLHALAQDAYGVEASFCRLRSLQAGDETIAENGEPTPTLESLYAQVLALIDEYKNICEALEANAAANTARTETTRDTQSPDRKKRNGSNREEDRKKHDLPDWVYVDSRCTWNSKSRNEELPVTIRKVCYHRLQVLVIFDDTPTHRKILAFKDFKDEGNCPLAPRSPDFRKRSKKRTKGQALAAVEKAEDELADDLRGLVEDLGVESLASARLSARLHSARSGHNLDSDGDSDNSTSTSSTAEPPPEEPSSDPSTQHSARFGKDASPNNEALTKAAEEEAKKIAAAVRLQAAWRSHNARRCALSRLVRSTCLRVVAEAEKSIAEAAAEAALRARKEEAATRIQSRQRGIIDRRRSAELALAKAAAAEAAAKAAAEEAARAKAAAEAAAAIIIQSAARGSSARRRIKATKVLRRSVRVIVARWRACDLLDELKRQKDADEAVAALTIQRQFRGFLGRRKVRARIAEVEEMKKVNNEATAAKVIQGVCRGHLKRQIVLELQLRYRSAAKIQAVARGRRVRRREGPRLAEFMAKRMAAALVIQAAYRGIRSRRQVAEEKRVKGVPATKIQRVWRGARERAKTKPLIQKRAKSAVIVQRCWRGRLGRLEAMRRLKERSAALISSTLRTIAAKVTLAELRRARAEFLAAVRIQSNWRRVRAVKTVAGLKEHRKRSRAALRIQTCWRGLLGRRRTLDRRVQAANEFLETLLAGEVSFGEKRDTAWLLKVLAALEYKERKEADKEIQELEIRRRQEAGRLPQGDDSIALRMKGAADMDRGLAAVAAARARHILRMRTVFLGQVESDATPECDPAMVSAGLVNEGLLARLAPDDAVEEISSLIATAWAIAASSGTLASPAKRPKGTPAPFEVLRSCITALQRRLAGEVLGDSSVTKEEDIERASETIAALQQAEGRAKSLLELALEPMRAEIKAIRDSVPMVVKSAKDAAAKVPEEVKIFREKRAAETAEAETKLREEREQKHIQTQALHDIAMKTQVEKERLEGALYNENSRKGPKVYALVLENVKTLQQQIKDLEVSGTSNRKNQGILAHSLRALEVRASKAANDTKTYAYIHPGEKLEDDDYKPSEQVKKKIAKREENEHEFRAALEAEVATLKRNLEAKASHESAELGAKLRAEAEVHGREAQDIAHRLRAWRDGVAEARPWLGALLPLAKANVLIGRASLQMKKHRGFGDSFDAVVGAILPMVQKLKRELPRAEVAESPREDDVGSLASALGDIKNRMAALLKAYPDPEVPSPNTARELLTRRSVMSDDDEQQEVDHFITPGKLRPADKHARAHLSPQEADFSDEDSPPGQKKTAFEKTKGLPARTQSKALSHPTALANMGMQLDALKQSLANATGAPSPSVASISLLKTMPPPILRGVSPGQPPSAEPPGQPDQKSLPPSAQPSSEPPVRSEPVVRTRPSSAAGPRKAALGPSTATENRSDKIGAALRQHGSVSFSSHLHGQQAPDTKSASGTGFKAVQEKRSKATAWS